MSAIIKFDKTFIKHYELRIARNPKLVKQFDARFMAFKKGDKGPPLNDHALSGTFKGLRSFSINGDIRVLYSVEKTHLVFLDIGTHNQVYK